MKNTSRSGWVALVCLAGMLVLPLSAVAAPDAYEADDTIATAKAIANSQVQNRNIHAIGNEDWARFVVQNPGARDVELLTNGRWFDDTQMWVYRGSDGRLMGYNDDWPGGTTKQSKVTFALLAPGTYYAKIRENGNNATIGAYLLRARWEGVADAYELDDQVPRWIANGVAQARSIHAVGDVDRVTFRVPLGTRHVRIETDGALGDTQIWVSFVITRANGQRDEIFLSDDDSGNGLFSKFTCDFVDLVRGSTFNVMVREKGNNGTVPAYVIRATWSP